MIDIKQIDSLSGFEFESAIKPILEAQDFSDVEITQKSNDSGVDALAKKNNLNYAVQLKRYSKNVGLKAVQEVLSGMSYFDADNSEDEPVINSKA